MFIPSSYITNFSWIFFLFNGKPPLHIAARNAQTEACIQLVRFGARLDLPDRNGRRALHVAVLGNHPAVVDVLVSLKTDVNAIDKNQYTPLAFAAFRGNESVNASRHYTPLLF